MKYKWRQKREKERRHSPLRMVVESVSTDRAETLGSGIVATDLSEVYLESLTLESTFTNSRKKP